MIGADSTVEERQALIRGGLTVVFIDRLLPTGPHGEYPIHQYPHCINTQGKVMENSKFGSGIIKMML